jgi:large repetitive protein
MSRMGTAVLALMSLLAVAGMMIGCNGFFVSPNSLASITVSPTTAVLSSASDAGTLTISASGVLVNGNGSTISPDWTTSDTTGTVLTISPATGTSTTVTPTPGANGTATVTATSGGQSAKVQIDVIPGTISGNLTVTPSAMNVTSGQTVTVTVTTSSGQPIPSQFVSFSGIPASANLTTGNGNASITFLVTVVGQSATITATVTTNGNTPLSGSATINFI